MSDFNPDCVLIPLSKTGKHAGKFTVIVSPEDADLANLDWNVLNPQWGGYARISPNGGKTIHMHRVIMERILNRELSPKEQVDHINGCSTDNRRENLRVATPTQNQSNRGRQSNNTTGYKGVVRHGNKYQAQIIVNKKRYHLGTFTTPEQAYESYCKAAKEYFGDFAHLHDVDTNKL